jgi:hypothetical protein
VSHFTFELRSSIGPMLAKEALVTLARSGEAPKDGRQDGKTHSTFLPDSPQPRSLGIDCQNADDYQSGSRQNRKNQPHNAKKNKNPAKGNHGDALHWFLWLSDSNLLHTDSPLRLIATARRCRFNLLGA